MKEISCSIIREDSGIVILHARMPMPRFSLSHAMNDLPPPAAMRTGLRTFRLLRSMFPVVVLDVTFGLYPWRLLSKFRQHLL